MGCPFQYISGKLRGDLPELTKRLAKLPVDQRGYPVPFFVAWIDGQPDFRVADPAKLVACVRHGLCWVCGENLGSRKSFVVGPMCAVNRNSAEPPSHPDCAEWSLKGCPFLAKPNMVRREDETTKALDENVSGVMIKRNPGVMLCWETRKFTPHSDGNGGVLFDVGEPHAVSWWREGRPATRAEAMDSIESGIPLLMEYCDTPDDKLALASALDKALKLLPA